MERESTRSEETGTVELGAVSIETRGPFGPQIDLQLGQVAAGLHDD